MSRRLPNLGVKRREEVCIPLHNIITGMFADGQYPYIRKRAQVTPVPKIKQPSIYKHLRPIKLLYHIEKLTEQAIVNKLKAPLKDAIASNQYAYRP